MSKVVLITGGTSGMGKETSLLLANSGYRVYAGSRGNALELEKKAKELSVNVNLVPLDVQDINSIKKAVCTVIEK